MGEFALLRLPPPLFLHRLRAQNSVHVRLRLASPLVSGPLLRFNASLRHLMHLLLHLHGLPHQTVLAPCHLTGLRFLHLPELLLPPSLDLFLVLLHLQGPLLSLLLALFSQ